MSRAVQTLCFSSILRMCGRNNSTKSSWCHSLSPTLPHEIKRNNNYIFISCISVICGCLRYPLASNEHSLFHGNHLFPATIVRFLPRNDRDSNKRKYCWFCVRLRRSGFNEGFGFFLVYLESSIELVRVFCVARADLGIAPYGPNNVYYGKLANASFVEDFSQNYTSQFPSKCA